jgi:hypothetical protein
VIAVTAGFRTAPRARGRTVSSVPRAPLSPCRALIPLS